MGTGLLGLGIFFWLLLAIALKWEQIGNAEAVGLACAWIGVMVLCRLSGWNLLIPLGSASVLLNAWLLYRLDWLSLPGPRR